MAVMASSPALDSVAIEHKTSSVQRDEDAMARDAEINGRNGTNGHVEDVAPLKAFAAEHDDAATVNNIKGVGSGVNNGKLEGTPESNQVPVAPIEKEIVAVKETSLKTAGATQPASELRVAPAVTVAAETVQPTISPLENSSAPSQPVAAISSDIFMTASESLPSEVAEIPTTVPPRIEQPTSDVRDDTQEDTTMSETQPELVLTQSAVANDAEDKMDISRDLSPSPAQPSSILPPAADASQSQPLPSKSEIQAPIASSAMDTSTPMETTPPAFGGQVRQREEEEDDNGPSAKRTKVDGDGPSVPNAQPTSLNASANAPPPGPVFDPNPLTANQKKYLLEMLRKAKKIKAALPFLSPVDPVALNIPTYPERVPNPMDLSTIESKLKREAYVTATDLWDDISLMVRNCEVFNGPEHAITIQGLNLKAYFQKLMITMPKGTAAATKPHERVVKKPAPPPKAAQPPRESRAAAAKPPVVASKAKDEHKSFLDSNGMPIIRRDSSANDRPKREIIKPPPRDLPYSGVRPKKKKLQYELKFCDQVLKELSNRKHKAINWPFMAPVDPVALNLPTYHKTIKKPMDFGTIRDKLQKDLYANSKDFHADAKLVFANCYKFNHESEDVYKMGKQLEEVFDQEWENKAQWMAENQPASEPVSDESEEDESEAEEEVVVTDKMSRMMEIQQQIAALSAEAMNLTTATTPKVQKAATKKTKTKPATATKKRPSTGGQVAGTSKPKASKSDKPKKAAKKLTLEQKRYVSEGITQLDEPNMRKAVQIIRNGVPALKDVHDDELELDVDEIPDHVLIDLYKFVKAIRESTGADVAEDDDYYEDPADAKPATTSTGRKKNKPMSAREQESKIQQVRQQLQRFDGGSGSDRGGHANVQNDDSSDDESSSSEEE